MAQQNNLTQAQLNRQSLLKDQLIVGFFFFPLKKKKKPTTRVFRFLAYANIATVRPTSASRPKWRYNSSTWSWVSSQWDEPRSPPLTPFPCSGAAVLGEGREGGEDCERCCLAQPRKPFSNGSTPPLFWTPVFFSFLKVSGIHPLFISRAKP